MYYLDCGDACALLKTIEFNWLFFIDQVTLKMSINYARIKQNIEFLPIESSKRAL